MHVPRQLRDVPRPRQTFTKWAILAGGSECPSLVKGSNEVVVTASGAKGTNARTNTSSMGAGEKSRTS